MASKTTPSQNIHVPMDAASDVEIVRSTLKSVLHPMGLRFTVRGRYNDNLGDYASISIANCSNLKTRRPCKSK